MNIYCKTFIIDSVFWHLKVVASHIKLFYTYGYFMGKSRDFKNDTQPDDK